MKLLRGIPIQDYAHENVIGSRDSSICAILSYGKWASRYWYCSLELNFTLKGGGVQ